MNIQLPTAWTALRYHPLQDKLWRSKAQFVAVAAGRGSGKTLLARRRVVRFLPVKKEWSDPIYFYALPTIKQAKRVAWKKILQLVPKEWIKRVNNTDLTVETVFGSTLYVMGMDRPQSAAEGSQYDGGVLDESCDHQPKVFDLNILPALSERSGWCWRIGVPKRHGRGARDFKRFYDLGTRSYNRNVLNDINNIENKNEEDEEDDIDLLDIQVESYTWPSKDIISPRQLAWAQENLDPRDFNEQYNATWESASGSIFYAFKDTDISLNGNLDSNIQYNPQLPLIIGQDFNVDPMCWVIGQLNTENKILNIFDELFIRNTNTVNTLAELHKRYGNHNNGFVFYADAASRARKTSASESDYLHILQWIQDGKFKSGRLQVPRANPRLQNRFAACNALFCNASNVRRCFIHPKCKHLRQDLQERQYKEGTNEPDDYSDIGHMSDALGYIIHLMFPVSLKLAENVGTSPIAKIPGDDRTSERFVKKQVIQQQAIQSRTSAVPIIVGRQ